MSDEVTYRPLEVDRYGGKVLELVVRRRYASHRWGIDARTESYGGNYLIPVAWLVRRSRGFTRLGWKRKRDALAYLATIQPVKE